MERLSALMDGELDVPEVQRELSMLKTNLEARERWDSYHLIGDVLRGDALRLVRLQSEFTKRLAAEPTVLAPRMRRSGRKAVTYALSAAASVAAVAMVAWVALTTNDVGTAQQVASVQQSPQAAVAVVAPQQAPVVSVPVQGEMNEYLLAHQGFSPSTAIQGVTPYIRSVSATQPASAR
jgi:sigma-E factor negative regulatory protein RseA